jgi:hypothetical protein
LPRKNNVSVISSQENAFGYSMKKDEEFLSSLPEERSARKKKKKMVDMQSPQRIYQVYNS